MAHASCRRSLSAVAALLTLVALAGCAGSPAAPATVPDPPVAESAAPSARADAPAAANCDDSTSGCSATLPVPVERARGNEPFWRIDIDQSLRFAANDVALEGPAPPVEHAPGLRRYRGTIEGQSVVATFAERVCRDTMSGMPHPYQVDVVVDANRYSGCGGEPRALLTGAEWVVEWIDGGIIDRSRATLVFAADGGLGGRASCNTFTATYTLSGEALAITAGATTRMACVPALMEQEQRFLDILQNVQRFDIDTTGALVLTDVTDRRITARRE